MIQKIKNDEYLSRLDNMPADEKDDYLKRVGDWLENQAPLLRKRRDDEASRFQNVLQCGIMWNDKECQAWTDGVRLLTALVANGDTWLPDMLYTKSAKRAIRNMVSCFKDQISGSRDGIAGQQAKQVVKEESAVDTRKGTQAVAPFRTVNNGNQDGEANLTPDTKVTGTEKNLQPPLGRRTLARQEISNLKPEAVRPKHIDQYIHLLPAGTQEKAATIRGLLRDMDAARDNARKLMDANEHPDKIAQWAKTVARLDEKVNAIYKEIDAEWNRLVAEGRVMIDDLGNAHVAECPVEDAAKEQESEAPTQEDREQAVGQEHDAEQQQGDGQQEAQEQAAEEGQQPADDAPQEAKNKGGRPALTEEQKAARKAEKDAKRLEYLKKYLRDTRTKATPERQKQWKKNLNELLKLGGEITESIRKAADTYGINVDDLKK